MAVSVGLLKKAVAREGWLEKAKQAKSGKDEMRGGWKPRYFVLDGHHLRYFKKEDQKTSKTKAAGTIELKDAKIDPVEPEKTEGRRHCFKVQSSDYNYTYIQSPNEEDREWWVYSLRKAAKYDDPQSMYHMKLLDPEAAKKEKDKEEKEKAAAAEKAEKAGVSPEKKGDGKSPATSPTGLAKKKVEGKLSSEEPPGTFASDSSTADETWVAAWGFGQNGELGDTEGKIELAPVVIAALTKLKVLSVAAGRSHAAAVTDKGRLYVWGLGDEMQLGLGSRIKQSKAPTMQTRLVRETVVQAACGDNHTMCLTHTGEVYSWGDGTKGQLGHGELKSLEFPTIVDRISKAEKKCRMIAASGDNSAGIINEYICVWGVNDHGQLGIPDPEPRPKPGAITELPLKDDKIKQIELGASFAAVVMESGTLWTVGNNSHGQCGHTAKADHHIIRQVLLASQSGSKCLQVSCGSTHMIAIVRSNDGKNSAYIFGEVDSKNSGKLGQAAVLPGGHYAASSHSHFLVLVPEGGKSKVWGCGKNEFGQLGTGNVKPVTTYTQSVISNELEIIQLACGHQFSVGLFKGSPPDKLVEGTVDKYETEEEREAKLAKLAEEKAKAKAEEEKKKKEAEEAEKKKKEEEEKRKQAKLAILREHYGDIKPCSVKGCISGRKAGNIHCERHFESPSLPIDPEALPPVWQKLKHEKNDKFYYVNTATKKTQWKKPEFDISLLHE